MSNIQKADRWYDRQIWRGPYGLRLMILRRDVICVLCQKAVSTVADHIVPFRSFATEQAQWNAFTDDKNLRGVCAPCHSAEGDRTIATASGQRRNRTKPAGIEILTDHGIKFVTSSLGSAVLDKAIATAWEDSPK
jgi:5-methylcytosine-specific restriction endonuclease McrA